MHIKYIKLYITKSIQKHTKKTPTTTVGVFFPLTY